MVIAAQTDMKPPIAKKVPQILKIHGYEITDNYFWLRGDKDHLDPAIRSYLEDNNRYTESVMGKYQGFVNSLYEEMIGRVKQDDESVPYKKGNYWYFTRTEKGKQYATYLRGTRQDGSDASILLDTNEMAKPYKFFAINEFDVSDDGNILAFSVDTTGYRQYTLRFKDLRTGNILPDKIERVTSFTWTPDNKTVFFTTEDAKTKRTDTAWRYVLGSQQAPAKVFYDDDVLFGVYVGRSRDGKMLFIGSGAKTMDEFRYLAADTPDGEWNVFSPRREGHQYSLNFDQGEFFVVTNKDGAENFKVMKVSASNPAEKNWKDYIPYDPKVHIDGIDLFDGSAILSVKENGLEYLRVMDRKTRRAPMVIATPESVYTMSLTYNPEYSTPVIRYRYSSMITPNSVYEFDLKTRKSKLIKQEEIPSGYDKTKYETERVWAVARDGVKVPVVVMMKKGTKLDGKSPMLLYGYGSYGASMTAGFSAARLSLVDRGMIYGLALIRGGGELGEAWRLAGRMYTKMNTFNDFVDSAKWLIANKYTSSDRLVIQGGSAGGLLMGASVNRSPETFKAAIVQVPFVDVMNTMLDETLPLTTEEWIEWGNPHIKKDWDYMVQYSPYENVKAQPYPNMLIEVSLNDSQVPYWEGAKFAAKVRELKTNDSVILLKTNMGAGHGGSSGRYDRLKEVAFDYAYALTQTGITK